MHLLILTPALPYPPHQGGALRNFGIIHGLHHAGHQVSLLSFDDGSTDYRTSPLQELCTTIDTVTPPQRSMAHRLHDLIGTRSPDLMQRLMSDHFRHKLIQMLQQSRFDLIQFEGLEMAGYLQLAHEYQPQAKLCYDAHNAEYELQRCIFEVDKTDVYRWPAAAYSYIQYRRIMYFEREVCQQADYVLAVSEEDAASLRPFRPNRPVAVIPNGIFTEEYNGQAEELDLGENVLTFTGKMDYRPNVDAMLWFSDEVFPHIVQQVGDVKLYIVGQKPHVRLERLRDNAHINLTGWVPEISPFLRATDVYIAPLRMGSGTRLKILEAMAAGCAVVATSLAAAGLPDEARKTLKIVDSAAEMATTIINLLRDPDERKKIGVAARTVVRKYYDWSVLIPRLLTVYGDI